jgi:hypothetical protein
MQLWEAAMKAKLLLVLLLGPALPGSQGGRRSLSTPPAVG